MLEEYPTIVRNPADDMVAVRSFRSAPALRQGSENADREYQFEESDEDDIEYADSECEGSEDEDELDTSELEYRPRWRLGKRNSRSPNTARSVKLW